MGFNWLIMGRFSPEGAADVTANGMAAARDSFAKNLAGAPANGRVLAWYAVDDHQWDVAIIGEVDNDDPAFWARAQLNSRANARFAESRLLRLANPEDFDAVELTR